MSLLGATRVLVGVRILGGWTVHKGSLAAAGVRAAGRAYGTVMGTHLGLEEVKAHDEVDIISDSLVVIVEGEAKEGHVTFDDVGAEHVSTLAKRAHDIG